MRYYLTLLLPVMHICVNVSTVYNDTLVARGLNHKFMLNLVEHSLQHLYYIVFL